MDWTLWMVDFHDFPRVIDGVGLSSSATVGGSALSAVLLGVAVFASPMTGAACATSLVAAAFGGVFVPGFSSGIVPPFCA